MNRHTKYKVNKAYAAQSSTALSVKLGFAAIVLALACAAAFYPGSRRAYAAEQATDRGAEVKYQSPHDFNDKQTCIVCHEQGSARLRQDPVSTCLRCHEGNKDGHPVARHPIGRESRINFPATLPVAPGGKMVCYTCHEPHNKLGGKRLLRIEFDKLCASCHPGY